MTSNNNEGMPEEALTSKINREIALIGDVELIRIAIMVEWRSIYANELKLEFERLYGFYTMAQLAPLFRISLSTAYHWQHDMRLRRTRKHRRALRKNDRRIVPLLDLETGIYYDCQLYAAQAHGIRRGSIAQNHWFNNRFFRWADTTIYIMSKA